VAMQDPPVDDVECVLVAEVLPDVAVVIPVPVVVPVPVEPPAPPLSPQANMPLTTITAGIMRKLVFIDVLQVGPGPKFRRA